MARFVPREQTAFARGLRRETTAAEAAVWRALRGGGLAGAKFRRQVPVGPYVADFLCLDARLVVEIDGPSQDSDEGRTHDAERDAWFEGQGFSVLRFANALALTGTEILTREIERALRARGGSLLPSREKVAWRRARGCPPHPSPLRVDTFSREGRRGRPRQSWPVKARCWREAKSACPFISSSR